MEKVSSRKSRQWFEVDKQGLAKLLQRRGIGYALYELLQNAWDAKSVTQVDVMIARSPYGVTTLKVTDDSPVGFTNLDHAFTLFAESEKKDNPEKRGRFNLGEKLVLALAKDATISTTVGTVTFSAAGRKATDEARSSGSEIVVYLPISREQHDQIIEASTKVISPYGIRTSINGVITGDGFKLVAIPEAGLTTEISDGGGILRRTTRKTRVGILEVPEGEKAWIFEMGIPVSEHDGRWHYNVEQKVPLTFDREAVSDGFIRDLHALAFNTLYHELTVEDCNSSWTAVAVCRTGASLEGIRRYMDLRFSEKRVAYDPSDTEANKIAASEGYTVVTGSMLSKDIWSNVKLAGAIKPAGQVTPSNASVEFSAQGKDVDYPPEKWSEGMKMIVEYTKTLGIHLLGFAPKVGILNDITLNVAACYGQQSFHYNVGRLGKTYFNRVAGKDEEVDSLILHEFAHEYCPDHLSHDYHEAICKLGAKLKTLALSKPEIFSFYARGRA